MNIFDVVTEYPIAFDSPDHLQPHGTVNDNHTNETWVENVLKIFKNKENIKVMDLGCAGGKLVKSWLNYTDYAIGLEGSNFSQYHRRHEWPQLDEKNLFTCDVSRAFKVLCNDEPFLCDIISAWEVFEHIHPDRLKIFLTNIYYHLDRNGLFMGSIHTRSDIPSGRSHIYETVLDMHQTIMTKEEWYSTINETNLFFIEEYDNNIGIVREDANSFPLKMRKK